MRAAAVTTTMMALAAGLVAGCDTGAEVAFNQRMFSLPDMTSAGSTCMVLRLGDDSSSAGGGGGASGLIMSIRTAKQQLFVEVFEGRTLLVRRSYDEAFFQSQRVDEVKVTATSGEGMLIRNWGSYGPGGQPECAPPEDDGSRPTQQP
jgi:hypothetical protein